MPYKLAEGKKRYSLTLTKVTMEKLQGQFVTVGARGPRQASGLISLMVDDVLLQLAEHVMPLVIEAKEKKGQVSEMEFMQMVFNALGEIGKK